MLLFLLTFLMFLFGVTKSLVKSKEVVNPFNFACFYIFVIFGVYPIFRNPNVVYLEAYWVLIVGVVSFYLGMLLKFMKFDKSFENGKQNIYSAKLERVLGGICLASVLFLLSFAVLNVVRKGSLDLQLLYSFKEARQGVNNLPFSLTLLKGLGERIFQPLVLMAVGLILRYNWRKGVIWALLVSFSWMLNGLSEYSGRNVVLFFPIAVFFIISFLRPTYANRLIPIVVVVGAFAFFTLNLVRHARLDQSGQIFQVVIQSIGSGGEWEPVDLVLDMCEYDLNPTASGVIERISEEIKYFIINWVPRPLWPGKPDTDFSRRASLYLYGHTYSHQNWVRNFTFIGQGIWVGGWFGVAFSGLLYGFTYINLLSFIARYPQFLGLYAFLTYYGGFCIRNALSTWIFFSISQLFVAIIFWEIIKFLAYGKSRRA